MGEAEINILTSPEGQPNLTGTYSIPSGIRRFVNSMTEPILLYGSANASI